MPLVATIQVLFDTDDEVEAIATLERRLNCPLTSINRRILADWEIIGPLQSVDDIPAHVTMEHPAGYLADLVRATRKH
jgi:hypothetical protein